MVPWLDEAMTKASLRPTLCIEVSRRIGIQRGTANESLRLRAYFDLQRGAMVPAGATVPVLIRVNPSTAARQETVLKRSFIETELRGLRRQSDAQRPAN